MKKLLALLLTLAMLLSMVGTMATAEAVKPTLTYPNVTTTVSDEGLLTVSLGGEIQNLSMLRVEFEDDTYWPADDGEYDAEKKAYTQAIDKEYAGKTPERVELGTWLDKDGKVDSAQYDWEDGKIYSVNVASGKREENETAKTTTYVMSGRTENYQEGEFSGYAENSWTNVYTSVEGGYTQKQTDTYKEYDEDGILRKSGESTYEESDVDKDDEKQWSNVWFKNSKDVYTNYNDFGVKRTTGTTTNGYNHSNIEDHEKDDEYTRNRSWYGTEDVFNKKGVQIYKYNYKDTEKNFDTVSYTHEETKSDAYGNVLWASTTEITPSKKTEKNYSEGALASINEYEYALNEDGTRKSDVATKTTETLYSNNGYGASAKYYQKVSAPGSQKTVKDGNGNTYSRWVNGAYTETYYDEGGAITSVTDYSADYTYSADEKARIATTTTKQYVGAVSDAELKSKTVITNKQYDNGDYENWTVTTDSTGKETSRTGQSRVYTPATATEKAKTVYTYAYTDSTQVETYTSDADGHTYNTSVTTNKDGKVTRSMLYAYDKELTKYVRTYTYNDKDGNLIGTSKNYGIDGGSVTNYNDKEGKLVYKSTYTYGKTVDGKYVPSSYTYTDADGKEIGYQKTDDKGQINNKIPSLNYNTFKLNGWTEETNVIEDNKEVKHTNKTYNKAGALTYESVTDNKAGTTTSTWYSLWDDGKTLATYNTTFTEKAISTYSTQKEITNVTTTFNQNPNYVKSKVMITPADTVEKNDKGQTTKRVSKSTTEYYDLTGALDRAEVTTTTTTYTYDEDGDSDSSTVQVKEWKNASGSAVVTKTTKDDAKSGENRVEYKKADGTLIGYEKNTENSDGTSVQETVEANFNPYTGYVRNSSKTVTSYDKKGRETKREEQSFNEKGEVTDKSTEEYKYQLDREIGGTRSEAHYYKQEDGALALGWDNTTTWDNKAGTSSYKGGSYYPSGKAGRTWEGTETYDKEKDVWNVTYIDKDVNGNVVLTKKGTVDKVASAYGEEEVYDLTYTDAKGNVVGYKKTDANGTVTEKIPFDEDHTDGDETAMTISGKLNKGWKETVTDVRGNTTSEKIYNAKGQLMQENHTSATAGGYSEYWRWTAQPEETGSWATTKGIKTTTTTYYNEDGTMRKTVVNEEGRASGTHVKTSKTTVSNANGVVYTYESTTDLQTDKSSAVYKDAAGKEIGHYTKDKETGAISELTPTTGNRTGKIMGFTLYEKDKDGAETYKTYDAGMTLLSSSTYSTKKGTNEDGYTTTSYYKDGSDKAWKVETYYSDSRSANGYSVYGGYTESAKYNQDGVKYASEEYQSYSQGLAKGETRYYDKDGKLVYSRVSMREPIGEDQERWYTVYLGADGKEIARQKEEDNGDSVEKYPTTTAGNVITGWYETITSDDGTVTITRKYDANNVLVGETYRKGSVVVTDDQITRTTAKKDGTVVSKTVVDLNEDREVVRYTDTSYDPWNGAYLGESRYYPASDDYRWPAYKNYDENGNLVVYGWRWDEDDYSINESYWVNGQLEEYSWSDKLGEDGSFTEAYNADGSYYQWIEDDGNGTRSYWWYGSDGKLDSLYESTPDGVTNVTYYNKDGSVRGYDWGITSGNYGGELHRSDDGDIDEYGELWYQDSVVWDANKVLYTKHIETDPESDVGIETWKDTAGNVKVKKASGTTVTLTNNANGWHQAFGNEWYYVEGGQIATGWKQLDGTWYYFDKSGKMATGVFVDDKTTYAADADGAWVASGWNVDEYDNWQYIENGTVVTGWKQIGGKWYYFDDGWYIDTQYDSTAGWKQRTGGNTGNMATGAAHIWNDSWTEKITYFFNADGSWDTTPGWKTDGIDSFYFYKGGQRATGWKKIGKDWYYFASNGVMRNGWVGGGSSWYYMDPETGKMVENDWIQEKFEDTWYYADKGGEMATGWREIDGDWYYFNSDGDMASQQWVKSGSDWYFMKKDGDMATGWAQDKDEKWYHMDEDGTMESSQWVGDDASGWYYVGEDGAMLTGTQTIDGRVNIFDENGLWIGYGD